MLFLYEMEFEVNENIKDFDLDKYIHNDENRKPNAFGLYKMNTLVIGKTGSGKTTALVKFLLANNIDDFGLFICIIPRESADSGIYSKLGKYDKRFVQCVIGEDPLPTIKELNEISESIGKPMAVILDDFITVFNKDQWKQFERYITQSSRVRNGCSIFALSQNLQFVKPVWKKNFNAFCIFVNSFTERQWNDFIESYYDGYTFDKAQKKNLYQTLKGIQYTPLWLFNNSDIEHSMMLSNVWLKFNQ